MKNVEETENEKWGPLTNHDAVGLGTTELQKKLN
jgi:hypothetical protein